MISKKIINCSIAFLKADDLGFFICHFKKLINDIIYNTFVSLYDRIFKKKHYSKIAKNYTILNSFRVNFVLSNIKKCTADIQVFIKIVILEVSETNDLIIIYLINFIIFRFKYLSFRFIYSVLILICQAIATSLCVYRLLRNSISITILGKRNYV